MKKWKIPDTFVIIFFVVLLAGALTHIIPAGSFDMKDITYTASDGSEKTKSVPIAGSFHYALDEQGQPLIKGIKVFEPGGEVGLTNYVYEGLVSGDKWGTAVGVVAFILVLGGAFGIILKTGAVETGLYALISKTKGSEILIIPLVFILFSLGGAVFGMGEEAIPFAMILVPIIIGLGYDSITALMITYCSTQIGFATSWMNPFSVAVAQGVAGIPVLSGSGFRIFMWIFFTAVGTVFTMRYAKKIKNTPTLSVAYETDAYYRDDYKLETTEGKKFTLGHKLVLLVVVIGMVWVIWGVIKQGYYLPEIATQFLIMGIVSGIIGVVFRLNNMTTNDMASSFRKGAEELVGAALVVGMGQGIVLVLGGTFAGEPSVLNTILNWVATGMEGMHSAFSAWVMYIFQSCFNFFVVSGSGQAALTMPIMAPLADLLGVTRQVAVLAFQLGDGFTNLIVPTGGVLMAMLGVARLEWGTWVKFQWKFQVILFVLGSIFMIGASLLHFS